MRNRRYAPTVVHLRDVETGAPEDGYRPMCLVTDRGPVQARHYAAAAAHAGVIWVDRVFVA